MRIISIDPSLTCTGIWMDPDRPIALRPPRNAPHNAKLGWLLIELEDLIGKVTPEIWDLAVVEGYAYNSPRTHAQAEIGGIIRALLNVAGFRIVEVSPALWKANMMGPKLKGAGKKNRTERTLYLSIVERTFGKTFITTDEADAFMMAEFVRRCAEGEQWGTPSVPEFARGIKEMMNQGRLHAHDKNAS